MRPGAQDLQVASVPEGKVVLSVYACELGVGAVGVAGDPSYAV